jgi:hypothetical protein
MKKILLLLAFISLTKIYPDTIYNDNELVKRIAIILVENYDKKPAHSLLEKIIMIAAKKTYIKMLNIWKEKHDDVYSVKFDIDPKIQKIINVVKKNVSCDESDAFNKYVHDLMMLTLLNFNLYLDALKDNMTNQSLNEITCGYIDECLSIKKHYDIQENLYQKEIFLKNEIRRIMTEPKLKIKLEFEIYFFDLVNKIREQSIKDQLGIYYAKR